MRKTLLIMISVVLLIGIVAFAAIAYGRGAGMGQMGSGIGYNNTHNLTPEQHEKILAIRQDFQKETQKFRFDLQKKNLELQGLWAAQPLDQKAIDAKTKEVTALQVKITAKAREMHDKIKSVLTAEQLKQWEASGFNGGPEMRGQGRHGGHGRMGLGVGH
jgi:Spy/CpxP family protein refolding chaperone